jgi:ADP-heptose:LPS heptosyltransferase
MESRQMTDNPDNKSSSPHNSSTLIDTDIAGLKRFLLIPAGGIGDTIQFTPVIRNVKRSFPDAEIIVISGSEAATGVLTRSPFVKETVSMSKRSSEAWLSLSLRLRLRYGSFDAILAASDFSVFCSLLLAPRLVVAFQPRSRLDFGRGKSWIPLARNISLNEVEENLRLVEPLGLREIEAKTDLFMSDEDVRFASAIWEESEVHGKYPVFTVHAGSDTREKEWGAETFSSLIQLLLQNYPNCAIMLVGGPGEDVSELLGLIDDHTRLKNLVGRTTVCETAAVVRRSSLVISNDDSVAHIAAAVGTPVVAIFGPSDPRRVLPWNPDGLVRMVSAGLECSPCYFLYSGQIICRYGSEDVRCMKAVTPEMVMREVEALMGEIGPEQA